MIYVDEHLAVPICIRSKTVPMLLLLSCITDFFKAKKQMYGSDWQDT